MRLLSDDFLCLLCSSFLLAFYYLAYKPQKTDCLNLNFHSALLSIGALNEGICFTDHSNIAGFAFCAAFLFLPCL